tara:strand:- start:20741 stop:21067 length:327 start_codon:yes stop_codon:yes gene_type:complete
MRYLALILFFTTQLLYSQSITVIQFSAEFLKDNEISLKAIKDANTETIYLSKEQALFTKHEIVYIPTLLLLNNDEVVLRIESDISLKLPENALEEIQEYIDEIIESKF